MKYSRRPYPLTKLAPAPVANSVDSPAGESTWNTPDSPLVFVPSINTMSGSVVTLIAPAIET